MKLANPPERYDRRDQAVMRRQIEQGVAQAYQRGQDVELPRGARLILPSPNGTRFAISVADNGDLITEALP